MNPPSRDGSIRQFPGAEFVSTGVVDLFVFIFVWLCERAIRSRVTLREVGQVELRGETPKQLSAGATLHARTDGVNII